MPDTTLAVPFDAIPPKDVHWLHEGFVPFRHVTVVLGPAGTSKGITVLDYGARLTRHAPMPGETETSYGGPRDVIAVLPEDDANESVAWRLAGASAVTDRVHNLTTFPDGRWFTLQSDLGELGTAIDQIEWQDKDKVLRRYAADGKPHRVAMVILDPLLALSENDLRTRGQARPVMEALESLARKRHLVILLTHHTNANGQAASSRAIIETARNVLALGKPPKAPDGSPLRVMTVTKTNIGLTGAQLHYRLAGTPQKPHLVWAADEPATAEQERGYDIQQAPVSLIPPPPPTPPTPMAPPPVWPEPVARTTMPLPPAPPVRPPARHAAPSPMPDLVPPPARRGIVDSRRWRRSAA